MQNIKTIFLDWHGTICKNVFWEHLKLENKNLFDTINKILFVDNQNLIDEWMLNKVDIDDILNLLNEKTGINKEYLMSELIYSLKQMSFVIPNFANIIKQIQENDIKVVLASANMDVFSYVIDNLNLKNIFNDILLSNVLECMKNYIDINNNAIFFHDYIVKNNLKYQECVLIDDSKSLVDMCKRVGMNNIKVNDCKNEIENILMSFTK